MRETLKDFSGLISHIASDKLKPQFSPDCSDIKFTPTHQLLSRMGFDKVNTASFDAPITLIDQIENDGTWYGTYVMGSYMYGFLKGASPHPFTMITNVTELQAMQNDLAANYYLANDIDASTTSGWNSGAGFEPIGNAANNFTGTLYGNGHTITGLYINRPSTVDNGLIGKGGNVENVGLIDVNIAGSSNDCGALGGALVSMTDCYASGVVNGNYACGGLGGHSCIAIRCYSTCAVNGAPYTSGGLMGLYGNATDSFWDTETSGCPTSAGGTGKLTAEMKQQATFVNWDFSTIWAIVEGVSYPTLR